MFRISACQRPNAMFRVIFRRSRLLWLIAVTSFITFVLLRQVQQSLKPTSFEQHKFWLYNLEKEEPSPDDQKCQLPRVHPFDESILNYLSLPRIIKCNERQPSLTYIDENGMLQFNESAANQNQFKLSELFCYHQEVVRDNDMKISYGRKIEMTINGSTVTSDFVFVSCTDYSGFSVYSNIHCHVVVKDKWLSNRVHNPKRPPNHNVLIIGIDSISRLSFIRQLPETYQFLSKQLNAFIFRGMTKVGDNTFPNLVAMLTGKSVNNDELPKVQDPTGTYDEWPCLWKNFSDAEYATLYAEDMPKISLFNYLRGGLKNTPTDHYMRPFWLAVEASKLLFLSSSLCFGNIPKHLLQLNYTRAFVQEYSKRQIPFFAFSFFVELSHDYMRIVPSADGDFKSWLGDLFDSGHLNDTFLFFISDHGHRFDSMRSTLVGRIEERMPFFALVVPPSLYETHPQVVESLKLNVGRLITPYDIYFSILDVLNHDMQKWQLGTATSSRGTTIFSQISSNRTCEEAGIPDHYCVCEREEQLDVSGKYIYFNTIFIVEGRHQLALHYFCS